MPRGFFAVSCAVATIAGMGIGIAMASGAGGEGMTLTAIAGAILAFGAMCIVPLIGPPLVTADRFGLVVFGVSGLRTMLVLGAMLLLIEALGLPRRPVVTGLLGGVLPIMIAEAFAAVVLIHRRDQSRIHVSVSTDSGDSGASGGAPAGRSA